MNKKLIVFCSFFLLFNFFIEFSSINSTSSFIHVIGAKNFPVALILSMVILPAISMYFILAKKSKKPYISNFVFYLFLSLLVMCSLSFLLIKTSHAMSVWVYFVFITISSSLGPAFLWNFSNKYFHLIQFKSYLRYFIISEQVGIIIADISMGHYFYKYNMSSFVNLEIIMLLVILVSFFLVYKKNKEAVYIKDKVSSDSSEEIDIMSFFKTDMMVSTIISIFLLFSIVLMINYEFNFFVGEQFQKENDLNRFFSVFNLFKNIGNVFLGIIVDKYLFKNSTISKFVTLVPCVFLSFAAVINFYLFFSGLAVIELLKRVFLQVLYRPISESFISSFNHKLITKIRLFFNGILGPFAVIVTSFILLFFREKENFWILNEIILVLSVFLFLISWRTSKAILNYHLKFISSDESESCIKSIQAVGETKNLKALPKLMNIYEQTDSLNLKKEIILSIGKIKDKSTLEFLYKEFYVNDSRIQYHIVSAMENYRQYEMVYYLLRLISSRKIKNFIIRKKISSALFSVYKSDVVPFFMNYLLDSDERIVANAIENMWFIRDSRIIDVIRPYLFHRNNRIKVNAIILLYKFKNHEIKAYCTYCLLELKNSKKILDLLSFIFCVGMVELECFLNDLLQMVQKDHTDPRVYKNCAFALSKLNHPFGFVLMSDILRSQDYTYLHFFKRLNDEQKIKVINKYFEHSYSEKEISDLVEFLNFSVFDFSWEIDLIKENFKKPQDNFLFSKVI